MREHFYRPVRDSSGALLTGSTITVRKTGTTTPLDVPIYVEPTGDAVRAQSWVIDEGVIDFYLDAPTVVDIVVSVPGRAAPLVFTGQRVGDPVDGPYTIAVIPDTQNLSEANPQHFQALADYLTTNAESLNLSLILHVGDVVNVGIAEQYDNAAGPMATLFGSGAPFVAAIGNHDYDNAFLTDGTAADDHTDTSRWNAYFGPDKYVDQPWFSGAFRETGRSENMYITTMLGGRPTLVLSLEWGPRTATMAWADTVVAAHPHHDVIVVTHSFLGINGERTKPGGPHAPYWAGSLRGSEMWDSHMKAWPNLIAVFNGHHLEGNMADRVDVGDGGNAAFQQFANWQESTEGGQGRVVLYTVNPVSKTAHRRVYNAALGTFDTTAGYEKTIRLGETIPKGATDSLYSSIAGGLDLNTSKNYVSAPHAADANISDVDLRARVTMANWVGGVNPGIFVGKWSDATQKQYTFGIMSSGRLICYYSLDGVTTSNAIAPNVVPFTAGETGWVRVVRTASTGVFAFTYSRDYEPGVNAGTWTSMGNITATAGALHPGTSSLVVGHLVYADYALNAVVHDAEIWNAGGAAPIAEVRFDRRWTTYTDTAGHQWRINGIGHQWKRAVRPVDLIQRLNSLTSRVAALEAAP